MGEIVEPAKLVWKLKREKLMGIQWKLQGKTKNSGATNPRNRRKNSQRFQADRAQNEATQEQKTPPYFDSQKLMEMMMKEFFQ